jgi:hypothetical protein
MDYLAAHLATAIRSERKSLPYGFYIRGRLPGFFAVRAVQAVIGIARETAATLLLFAKTTSDLNVAAKLSIRPLKRIEEPLQRMDPAESLSEKQLDE